MQKGFVISIGIGIIALIAAGVCFFKPQHKVVYIKTQDVFDRFEMTKERKAEFETVANSRKHLLDSAELSLKMMAAEIQSTGKKDQLKIQAFEYSRQEYLRNKQEFDENNQALSSKYDEEIWNRLNQYSKDFGTEKKVAFLYGANGNGTIMYADEGLDVTEEFIQYINNKYKGIQ